jgi:hypothetical protein
MQRQRRILVVALAALAIGGGVTGAAAQTFSSGSTGADGAFNPPASVPPGTTVNGSTYTVPVPPNGTFHFTTITIPAGTIVKFARNTTNTPVTLLASGDVTIAGTMDVSGSAGANYLLTTATYSTGGKGGPGGYDGGAGETRAGSTGAGNGQGPGGGKGPTGSPSGSMGCPGGGAGYLAAGTTSYSYCGATYDGVGGPTYGNTALLPLLGGSGGGGGGGIFGQTGAGGGGGGGALVIASSGTLTLTGALWAKGGVGGNGNSANAQTAAGGGGTGGAIRLMATRLAGSGGAVLANGGAGGTTYGGSGGAGALGRIRLESFSSTAAWTFSHAPSQTVPGTVQLPSTPVLSISSVAGVAAPGAPQAAYAVPDITLPATATSPVAVILSAANVPLGTTITVTATPFQGTATTAVSSGLSGTLGASTATASVAIPLTQPVVLGATATFPLMAMAGDGPLYAAGEEITHVRVAAVVGGPSTVTYLTKSGREVVVR